MTDINLSGTFKAPDYDICVIGGGINGAGIARDAAGRGLSVLLVEARDLAQGTSSASTKLIHGGLRYLEQGEFRLVRESLKERETLMQAAPHLITPLDLVLPHAPGSRPKWMIALGLFIYDRLGGKKSLSPSSEVSLRDAFLGDPLIPACRDGFKYSDCWADDARLVVVNAMDAKARGADILTRTACVGLTPSADHWAVTLKDMHKGDEFQISAKMVVNAAGPWVRGILYASALQKQDTPNIRLVKGSHIIVPSLYDGDHAYLLQQPDKRVIFVIPYEGEYTLIGTTDEPFEGDAMAPVISEAEKEYLCASVNRFFKQRISPEDVRWTYSGVRPLFDDGSGQAQKVTRDYRLDLDTTHGPPLLSVFGGKLTTYRALAEHAVDKITGVKTNSGWTAQSALPGGDFANGDLSAFIAAQVARYPFLPPELAARYAKSYGTRMDVLLDGVTSLKSMGRDFGGGLYEAEIRYLCTHEFAQTSDDILWRRSKLGLHLEKKAILALDAAMSGFALKRQAVS